MGDVSDTRQRFRDQWHVLMGEFWGWVSGRALLHVCEHASAARDIVTVYRVREVIQRGFDVGWNDDDEHGGKIVPDRNHDVADAVTRLFKQRCPVWGEARGTSDCEVCGGDIIACPIYGPGERRRRVEEAR